MGFWLIILYLGVAALAIFIMYLVIKTAVHKGTYNALVDFEESKYTVDLISG